MRIVLKEKEFHPPLLKLLFFKTDFFQGWFRITHDEEKVR